MKKLGFIGAGNMALALAQGLSAKRLFKPAQLMASDIDAARRRKFSRATGVVAVADNLAVVAESEALVLAVKPQIIGEVLAPIGALPAAVIGRKLFISIAAGITLGRLEAALGPKSRVIRVMPNAPAMVGEGMAALVRGARATRADEAFAKRLLGAVGVAVALKDEALLDAVTALSGSGPAYVYLFIQALADAGASQGLSPKLALEMALQTVRGAEAQLRQLKRPPAELIAMVASPGGTTEAALRKFSEAGFDAVVGGAVAAAAARSRELGQAS